MVAIWGSHSGVSHCNSKRIFKLPQSRDSHRFEGGKFPQVLISKPNKDLTPRWPPWDGICLTFPPSPASTARSGDTSRKLQWMETHNSPSWNSTNESNQFSKISLRMAVPPQSTQSEWTGSRGVNKHSTNEVWQKGHYRQKDWYSLDQDWRKHIYYLTFNYIL